MKIVFITAKITFFLFWNALISLLGILNDFNIHFFV
jgi:hypothetical protein